MKIVVTGFDARSSRITPGASKFSMGYLIGEAFFQAGHDVDHVTCWASDLECLALLDEADAIYVGLASPLGLASTYTYTALSVLAECWNDSRLRLFIDDPDTKKVIHGAASAIRRQHTVDPLFQNKAFQLRPALEAAQARSAALYDVCAWLTEPDIWPTTFVPVQRRWLDPRATQIAGTERHATGIDFTRVADEQLSFPGPQALNQETHGDGWVIEPYRAARWASHVRVSGYRTEPPRVSVQSRASLYRGARGVLESPALSSDASGWWTPYAMLAAHVGTFYATRFSSIHVPGIEHSAYYVLPDVYETLSHDERRGIVLRQREELLAASPTATQVKQELLQ